MKTAKSTSTGLRICASLVLATSSVFAQTYTVTDVDPTGRTFASAMNDSNFLGGATYDSRYFYPRASYSNTRVVGHIADLSSDPNLESQIWDINAGSLGVGYTRDWDWSRLLPSHLLPSKMAALFTYNGGTISIGTLPGDTWSEANAVNDAGWVVGTSGNASAFMPRARAFLWVPSASGDVTRPGTMYELPCAAPESRALSINRDGLIGGSCGVNPYLWAYGAGYDITSWLPTRVDLGHGLIDRASADFGYCEVDSIANSYAFSVTCGGLTLTGISFVSTPAVFALTQVPGLGLADGLSSQVHINSINNQGCAVGFAVLDSQTNRKAIKYCPDNNLIDLNSVAESNGRNITVALDIDNLGHILANGVTYGNDRSVVLKPR